jgi:hypothetical protein
MARSSSKGRRRQNAQAKGGRTDKPLEPMTIRKSRDLASLRACIMRIIRTLEAAVLPQAEKKAGRKPKLSKGKKPDAEENADAAKPEAETPSVQTERPEAAKPETAKPAEKPAVIDLDRLLGRNMGVIGGIDTLTQLVIRLVDKEREGNDVVHQSAGLDFTEADEAELERRILAELDRIDERRREAGVCEEGV